MSGSLGNQISHTPEAFFWFCLSPGRRDVLGWGWHCPRAPFFPAEGKPRRMWWEAVGKNWETAFPFHLPAAEPAGTELGQEPPLLALCYCSLYAPAWLGRYSQLDFLAYPGHCPMVLKVFSPSFLFSSFFPPKLFGVTQGRLTRKTFHGRTVILQLPSQPGKASAETQRESLSWKTPA